ncbi:hypothetical protein ZYGR_0H02270 [Zygosaccharomyces rouxii]|uniref:UBX domain-containing protein n=1 Tax=Zygosaccharomyces rouxii TaxID=4956 RepID=A0A1Q2ZVF2_ZYGRO|nr:hypothetical protein ZYGR_0H02270 [Zygosaccharomyces rouxii]
MDGELFISSVEQAVSLSLGSQKSLVVYNGREEDDHGWLEKWLKNNDLLGLLRDKAVWLKLRPGSEQFKYFEQLFPSVVVPSVYVIKQGQIAAVIQGPQASANQLAGALGVSLGGNGDDTGRSSSASGAGGAGGASGANSGNSVNTASNGNSTANKSFKDEVAETTQRKHLEEVKRQKQMAREERERILQLVQADRAERKAMEFHSDRNDDVHDNIKDLNRLHAKTCVLMIRLTNSSTLTGHFDSKETLNNVRKWVDDHRTDGDCLYAFHRNIPRVTFTDSEELKSLGDLQLLPRSVLILKPLENSYTNVAEAKGPGLLGKVFTGLSSWLSRGGGGDSGDTRNADGSGSASNSNKSVNHSAKQDPRPENAEERDITGHSVIETSPHASFSNNEELTIDSPVSSRFESPVPHATDHHVISTSNPSDLNLPSRCVTPNVYQFINKDDDEKEKSTYNGNTINLEKKDDD